MKSGFHKQEIRPPWECVFCKSYLVDNKTNIKAARKRMSTKAYCIFFR